MLRSTRNRILLAPANLISRYTKLQAIKVLPLPVAICTSALGLARVRDSSNLCIARSCTGQSSDVSSGGMIVRLRRRL